MADPGGQGERSLADALLDALREQDLLDDAERLGRYQLLERLEEREEEEYRDELRQLARLLPQDALP
ncbi:MAG: hypothetical protein AB7N76_17405 [Planctomycetota bacterium]